MTDRPNHEPGFSSKPAAPPALWYTVENGEIAGPWSLTSLHDRARRRIVTSSTLIWTESMPDWAAYGTQFNSESLDEMSGRKPAPLVDSSAGLAPIYRGDTDGPLAIEHSPEAPFALDGERSVVRSAQHEGAVPDHVAVAPMALARDTTPRPWHRWLARIIDMYLIVLLAALVWGAANSGSVPSNDFAWALIAPALLLLVEPFLLHRFGATPGKGLLNIKVTGANGAHLPLTTSWARSFQTWTAGVGFGFPIISLFTLAHQYSQLKKDGSTPYDRDLSVSVSHGPVGTLRVLGIIVFLFTLVALMTSGSR